MNKLVSILLVATVLTGCSQGTSAQTQEDVAKLRMAALVLKYVDACENKSVPTYYVDKAQKIWSQATEADRKDVKAQVDAIPQINTGSNPCQEMGLGVRWVVAFDFKIPEQTTPTNSTPRHQQPEGLSAKITRIERSSDGYFYPLIVVDNQSSQTYDSTNWSCTFYNKNNEPVHEDNFIVKNVLPNTKTARKSITHTSEPWETSSCRFLD